MKDKKELKKEFEEKYGKKLKIRFNSIVIIMIALYIFAGILISNDIAFIILTLIANLLLIIAVILSGYKYGMFKQFAIIKNEKLKLSFANKKEIKKYINKSKIGKNYNEFMIMMSLLFIMGEAIYFVVNTGITNVPGYAFMPLQLLSLFFLVCVISLAGRKEGMSKMLEMNFKRRNTDEK